MTAEYENKSSVKGMHDLFGTDANLYCRISEILTKLAERMGFEEILTPIVEESGVFIRLGEESDVVTKQMYTFTDQNGLSITLRPEGTAPVVRALIEHRLIGERPERKFFYCGPMFRYERPQKGRQRQFYQFGVEYFGSHSIRSDLLVILLAHFAFEELGIETALEINTLGEPQERATYLETLTSYFREQRSRLCADCQRRLDSNVLRILDCKVDSCQPVISSAPAIDTHLSPNTLGRFQQILDQLTHLKIPFNWNRRLVRGLDYYTHTVFEFTSAALGSQATLCAGGRYDHLVEEMGGSSLPAVGWALGMERLMLILGKSLPASPAPEVFIATIGTEAEEKGFSLFTDLTRAGIRSEMLLQDKRLKYLLRTADRLEVNYVVIIGEDELRSGSIILRDMKSQTQTTLPFGPDLTSRLIGQIREKP